MKLSVSGKARQDATTAQQIFPVAAVIEFITGALIDNPRRVGKPLRGDLAGIHSARRGTYRVLYRINEQDLEVIVVRIEHRRDAYRPR